MRAYDYRLASFDRTHVFVANYVWDLPRVSRAFKDSFLAKAALDNWQLSGITTISSGEPIEMGITILAGSFMI